jgi:hypothetical protein
MKTLPLVLAAAVASSLLAGCGDGSQPPAPPAKSAASPSTEKVALAAPTGKVLLRIAGVREGNRKGGIAAFDMAALERLSSADVTVKEPFLKRDVRFRGVRLGELLRVAGAPTIAGKLKFHALDDYHVALTIDDLIKGDAMIATKADGKRIPLADGGPIRVVFLGKTAIAENTDNWIWSVDHIQVPAA